MCAITYHSTPAEGFLTVHTKLKFAQSHVQCQWSSCRLYSGISDKALSPYRWKQKSSCVILSQSSRTIWSWWYTFAVAFSLFSPLSNVVHCDLDIVTHYGQTLVSRVINASLCFPLKSADFNGSATCWGITKFREQLQLGLLHIFSKHIHKIDLSGFFFLYVRLTCD